MSPEQVAGRPLSGASDVFSAGVLFAELLTGARPFDGPGPVETMERIREAPPQLTAVAPALAPTLVEMLEKEPARRPGLRALITRLRERAADEFSVAQWARERNAQATASLQTAEETHD
jgi:serine/threonine protein kinase